MKELVAMKDELCEKFDLATYLDHCEKNFITAIENYEILAVPSFESILALTMGVSITKHLHISEVEPFSPIFQYKLSDAQMLKAQGEGKPYLYWNLVSAAATHCQSLGYHRESTYLNVPSSQAESIRRLFWTVYAFDKNMSLVLGRVSNMQSVEIDTRHPTISSDLALRAWDESFIKGINLAELQGRIFVGLYSNVTMARDSFERTQLISDLAVAIEKLHNELKQVGCSHSLLFNSVLIESLQINPEGVNDPQVFHLSRGNWDILFYSTLTLLFRASSTVGAELRISSDCFNAACKSLRAHLDFFPQYQTSQLLSDGEYFNWSV